MFPEALATATKLSEPMSFWMFLSSTFSSVNTQVTIWAFVCCTAGLGTHYLVRWAKDEIVGSLWCYLFHQSLKRTVLSLLGCASSIVVLVTTQAFYTEGVFVGWWTVSYMSFGAGYIVDNAINKGERPAWTAAERAVRADLSAHDNHPGKEKGPHQ